MPLLALLGIYDDAPRKWSNLACEIIESGEAKGKAPWGLTKGAFMANAASKSQAFGIFTAEYDLAVTLPVGPRAKAPYDVR